MKLNVRYVVIVFLCTASVCLAQETYHNEEFGFIIDTPSEWRVSLEDEWSDKVKTAFKLLYTSKPLCILYPSGIKTTDAPCIIVFGQKTREVTTPELIELIKNTGEKMLTSHAEDLAKGLLGKKFKQYREIDAFYDYNSSRELATASIFYKHNNEDNVYFIVARAKFIGLQRVIDFRGYWKGDDPDRFQAVFDEVIDSFDFDPEAKPSGNLSKEQKFDRILKWGGTILTISIILGFIRILSGR